MSDYSKELEMAINAAEEAALLIKKYRDNGNLGIKFKGKNDMVTDADLSSEKKIMEIINDTYPDDEIMAEETANNKALPEKRTWIIDPIDGTTNFTHGFPIYCVSIALWENREAKVGVLLEVNSGELYTAVKGQGAFLNGKTIQVSDVDDPQHSLIGTGFPYNDMSLVEDYIRFFKNMLYETQGVRRPGSAAYDLCCVASGSFDGFYEYSLNPWDVGAASLIIQEAGGVVTDWLGEDNWLYGQRIVAGNPKIHRFLLESIKKYISEENWVKDN